MCVHLPVCRGMCARRLSMCVPQEECLLGGQCGGGGALRMDSSEARSCAVLCTIRIKVAISGYYLLRDVLSSVLMAPPTKSIKKRQRRPGLLSN